MKRICLLLLTTLTVFNNKLQSQHSMGLMVGDYNSTYSYSLNPALSRTNPSQRAYINWWGASISGENNFMQYNAPFRIGAWIQNDYPSEYRDINGSMAFQQDWLPVNTSVSNFKLNYLSEVYGPSFFLPVDEIGTIGFGVKEVSGLSINGLNGDFGGLMRYGNKQLQKQAGKTIFQDEFAINTEKYQEWFMNLSGVAKSDDENVWKWGVTMKFLLGMGLAHIGSDNLDYSVSNDAKTIQLNQFNGRMFRSSTGAYQTLSRPMGLSFDFIDGAGLGVDLGVVYEHRPQGKKKVYGQSFCDREELQKYDWKFGASISDLGFINYQGSGSNIVSLGNSQWVVDPLIIQNTQFSGEDRLQDLDERLFRELGAQTTLDIFSTTPAALNIQYDKNLGGKLHVGAYWTQNLKRTNSVGLRRASYVNITPRWQTEQWEYGMPVTLANDYSTLHVGIYGRIGPVIVGTDNLVGLGEYLGKEKFTGANFYFGIRSKIGGCDKRTRQYSFIQKETIYDTIYQIDTQKIKIVKIQRDTIIENKKETVKIKNTDSLNKAVIALEAEKQTLKAELDKKNKEIDNIKQNSEKAQKECQDRLAIWIKDAEKCKKAQADIEAEIKKKTAEIEAKKKEWEAERENLLKLANFPKNGVPKTDTIKIDCAPELAKKQAEIEVLESQRNKALISLEESKKNQSDLLKKCEDEKKALQDYLDKLQAELTITNKAKSNIEAENKVLKDQIERLSGTTLTNPCDVKLIECEKNLAAEKLKNTNLSLELEKEKAKTRNAQILADAADSKLKVAELEVTTSKAEALRWKTNYEQALNDKKICDELSRSKDAEILALKSQIQLLKKENETLKLNSKTNTNPVPAEDCTPYKTKAAQLEIDLAKAKADLTKALATKEDCTPYKTKAAQLEMDLAKAKAELTKALATKEDCTPYKTKAAQLEIDLAKAKADLTNAMSTKEDCTPYKTKAAQLEIDLAKAKAEASKAAQLEIDLAKAKAEASKAAQLEIDLAKAKADLTKALVTKEDCEPLKLKVANLEAELSKTQAQNKSDVNEISKLKSQIQTLENQPKTTANCTECENALKTANANLATVTANLNTAENKLKESQSLQIKCNNELIETKKQLQSALELKVENDELKKRVADMEVRINELESTSNATQLAQLTEEVKRLKAEIVKKDNQINGCKLQSDQCLKKLSEVELKLSESDKAKNEALVNADNLRKQVVTLDEDMTKMGEIIKTNNAEISKLNTEVSSLKTKLKACETKVTELTAPKEPQTEEPGN